MIISKTPMRVSLIGGETDLPFYYEDNEYGCVVSTTIDRYVYICVKNNFDKMIRLRYSENEYPNNIIDIKNDRIQSVFKRIGIRDNIEMFYISDIPKRMGLGGSSSFTVGMLNAISKFKNITMSAKELAKDSCDLEIYELDNLIGKQDQYAAAFGGLNFIKFFKSGKVDVVPISIPLSKVKELFDNLLFIRIGNSHESNYVLSDIKNNIKKNVKELNRIKFLAEEFYTSLLNEDISTYEYILKESWELKKRTSKTITTPEIDYLYDESIRCGAKSGKILGSGGGGFLMMYFPLEYQNTFIKKFKNVDCYKFGVGSNGSKIVYNE